MAGLGGSLSPGGNILYNALIAPSLTPVAVAANTTAEQSFTIPGLQINDFVDVYYYGTNVNTPAGQTAGIGIVNNRASAANTIQIGFVNSTGGSLTPAAGIYFMAVCRPEVPVASLPTNCA